MKINVIFSNGEIEKLRQAVAETVIKYPISVDMIIDYLPLMGELANYGVSLTKLFAKELRKYE